MNDNTSSLTLPKDLYGGMTFTRSFSPEPLATNQIWRKSGPADALKILEVMIEGHPEYRGGIQGINVIATTQLLSSVRWHRTFIITGDEAKIHSYFKKLGYSLTYPFPQIVDLPLEAQYTFQQFLIKQNKLQPQIDRITNFYHPEDYTEWTDSLHTNRIRETIDHICKRRPIPTEKPVIRTSLALLIILLCFATDAQTETTAELAKHSHPYIESIKNLDVDKCLKPGAVCEQNIVQEIKKITDKYVPLFFNHYKELVEAVFKAAK